MARSKTSKSNNQGGSSSFTAQNDPLGGTAGGAGGSTSDQSGNGANKDGQESNLNETLDKLAKAAMSKEMLAAGLAAAAAAISASPSVRRKIRDAGLDAADSASSAASSMASSVGKLGSLIAEAVADAAQRVMSGKWSEDEGGGGAAGGGRFEAAVERRPASRPRPCARQERKRPHRRPTRGLSSQGRGRVPPHRRRGARAGEARRRFRFAGGGHATAARGAQRLGVVRGARRFHLDAAVLRRRLAEARAVVGAQGEDARDAPGFFDLRLNPRWLENIAYQAKINLCSSSYLLTSNVYLNYVGVRRVELLVGKISTEH